MAVAFAALGTETGVAAVANASIAIPAGVTINDIILVILYIETSVTITPPAGFSEATNSPAINTNYRLRIYWKRQTSATGAGETTGSYTFTFTASWRSAVAARFTGAITTGVPFDVTNSAVNTSSAATTTPAVSGTTTVANTLLVWVGSSFDDPNYSTISGFTEHLDSVKHDLQSKGQAAAGATGSLSSTVGTPEATTAWLGALKPPAVVIPGRQISNVPRTRANLY